MFLISASLLIPILLLGEAAEAFAEDFGALEDVDEGVRVDVVEDGAQLDHVGTVESDVEHIAFGALVEARTADERATALDVVDDVVAHGVGLVGDDEHGLVGLETVNHEVDDLALDEDDDDGVNGQADVTKGDEGAQGDDAIDNHDEGTQGNLGVFVQNHRDDVRAAAGSTRAENQTDGHAVDDTGNHRIEEIVGTEPTAVMGNLDHRLDHRGVNGGCDGTIEDDGIIAPPDLEDKGEQEYQRRRDDGLDTELGAKNPGADNQQGDIHADGVE